VAFPLSATCLSTSLDRNAYVWEPSPSGWKPTLVLLRINRAATFVRWSPSEKKFAVGSGARVIAVCYFEEENDWWVSKHLKKPIRSTITSLAWHPNSVLLAAGSTDSHARVFSGFIKGIDARPESSVWGERLPFNTVCGEYLNDSAGWIHDVAFSPSGDALAFAAHDSSITVVYPSAPEQPPKAMINVSTQMLPFTSLIWSGDSEIIAAGHVRFFNVRHPRLRTLMCARTASHIASVAARVAGSSPARSKLRLVPAWAVSVRNRLSICSVKWI
jgi:actin related protein 2/3 complex, subunit 1A/1B